MSRKRNKPPKREPGRGVHDASVQQQDSALVAGINPVLAALRTGVVTRVSIAEGARNPRVREIEALAREHGVPVQRLERDDLERLAGFPQHQDVLAERPLAKAHNENELPALLDAVEGDPLLLVLDGVQDPHNLGACLRTAEAAGVAAVIVPRDRAVGLTPVARKASAGASEIIPLVQVTNLARTLRGLQERGIWLVGTSDAAETGLYQQDLRGPLALVMGNEGEGMRRLTMECCDYLVSIPMAGVTESLNVSVATGVCLYEIRRQRLAV
ncbi:23S rRNA (guanosine(2251)-2'-O)-methyltransferase RlmB [Marinihelvus fidelis]|uniref:23S rRNA (guanosine-2'-O-)-methyltransferase RlmB n=1 Tax=Marinihelvus fidelis TaxID=2613842 RepID=A0A5N0TDE6_9GAMM|nr:23S rRNA (guanosine(2251)-2'-O)-methyltransferase RlmB [Marinihelvus fidelis]KAA9133103.1 23S rRNA (guanosine(2251)-2'-O)-methyltransferase RlmB [Marinihelvus fidelis]